MCECGVHRRRLGDHRGPRALESEPLSCSQCILPKKLGQQNQPRPRSDSLQLLRTLEAGKERRDWGELGRLAELQTAGHMWPGPPALGPTITPRDSGRRPQLRTAARLLSFLPPCYGARGAGVLEGWASLANCPPEFQLEAPRHHPQEGGRRAALGGMKGLREASPAGIPATVPTCSRTPVWFPSSCPQ